MISPDLVRQEHAILRELGQLVAARQAAMAESDRRLSQRRETARETFDQATRAVQTRFEAAQQQADLRFQQHSRTANDEFLAKYRAVEEEYLDLRQRTTSGYENAKARAKRQLQEARWESTTVYDATKHKPKRAFLEAEEQLNERAERLAQIADEAKQWLFDSHMYRPPQVNEDLEPADDEEPLKAFLSSLTAAESQLVELRNQPLTKVFHGGMYVWIIIGLGLLLAYPVGAIVGWENIGRLAASLGGLTVATSGGLIGWLYYRGRKQALTAYDALGQTLYEAEAARQRWTIAGTAKWQRETAAIKQRHQSELDHAAEIYNATKQTVKERRTAELVQIGKYPPQLDQLKATHDQATSRVSAEHHQSTAQLSQERESALGESQAAIDHTLADAERQHADDWDELARRWRDGLRAVYDAADEVNRVVLERFPNWDHPSWDTWTPPREVSPVVPFGKFTVSLDNIPDAATTDERLQTDLPKQFTLPALLSFPKRCSLILRGGGAGRVRSVEALQATMLRFMMAIPPGKLRFTIVDPVGLGQNFAGFMHLADYDEQLVSNMIWTEPQQIERQLADLTQHMSTVIQKYLRNEYETIEDYNRHAGEVAEPFRVLVVANFPFNFTDAATRHLVSIANTGARCGVYTLVSVDPKLPLPHGFRMADLEEHASKLVWRETNFAWKEEPFENFPLTLEAPPENDKFSRLVHQVGEGAKDANRVEVPFEFIAPEPSKWWTGSTAQGIDVPLGRAGATKRQHLRLGRGTAQHVLVAGKTGSGKSTLLHALITNLSLIYSPLEVELYLIDFKKGVEFKTYAAFGLPHARVVAIESEREFGLSVLERLDAELRHRGERFRELGVQDLNAFRQAAPDEPSPRIMLIVDEFQEFFVEDDKLAQDASLLLDRLVRQGRAFGIHVHLGSQTLGGAYSLARSTLGQMAVRIALQCSEADANLILSEENSAARLLSRPGEAIYNDANGRSEGNNLFQVVWLSDDRKEDYLRRIAELARERNLRRPPAIVFEGNVPADVSRNPMLNDLLAAPAWPAVASTSQAWLGEAIAIKDPTAVAFRRQSGSNMIMIGQQAESALAMMSVAIVSLAAQHAPAGDATARFIVLDGQPDDAPHAGTLARLSGVIPQPYESASQRDLTRVMGELAAEVERRQSSAGADAPPIFVCIYDLARFRDLRKGEDDFGFSREEKPSPANQFVHLLREGPGVGIHFIVWCDTLNNLHRTFERATLREFESRVLFQMSVADSSSLIDSPAASRLGANRAFLHSEEQGRLEKFRPYRLPAGEWLAWVSAQLRDADRPAAQQKAESGERKTAN